MGLDTVELVLWAEQKFNISVSDEDASKIITVGEFSQHICDQYNAKHAPPISEGDVFEILKNHLITQFSVKPEHITRNAKIVKELGLE